MSNDIGSIINTFVENVEGIVGPSLSQLILYGSYARGDNTPESDIDIMVLVNMDDDEIKNVRGEISDRAFDLIIQYGVDISPIVINATHFNYWVDTLPFYHQVKSEGVVLNE